jgi:hypothetical protein
MGRVGKVKGVGMPVGVITDDEPNNEWGNWSIPLDNDGKQITKTPWIYWGFNELNKKANDIIKKL